MLTMGESDMDSESEDARSGDIMTVRFVIEPDEDWGSTMRDPLARRLRAELAELDVVSVALEAGGIAPERSKGLDAVMVGAVVEALSASGGVLIEVVRDWLNRQSARHRISVSIDDDSVELECASAAQKQQFVDAFIQRHAAGPKG